MHFPQTDTLVLPIRNTTVEEFSHLILSRLVDKDDFFRSNDVRQLTIGVSSGDGQWGSSVWKSDNQAQTTA